MYGGNVPRAVVALMICAVTAGCSAGAQAEQSLSGQQVARQLVKALHGSQFYKAATRAECEPVAMRPGAISDCTVWFREGIYVGDSSKHHPVRVTIDDQAGHFSYWVSG